MLKDPPRQLAANPSTPHGAPLEPPSHQSQHTYAEFRDWLLGTLTQPRSPWWVSGLQFAARQLFRIFDLLARLTINIADTVVGNWDTSWSGLAPYFAIFGLIDAKSTQEETREPGAQPGFPSADGLVVGAARS